MSRTERTRAAILDAAWRRLESDGTASLEAIATDAGVSRQALYNHFSSRAGLLLALVDHVDVTLGLPATIAEVVAIEDDAERLLATVRLSATYEPRVHGVATAIARLAVDDPDSAAAFTDRMEHRRSGLRFSLTALADAGRLDPAFEVDEIVDILWEAGAPSSYEHLVNERDWTPERWAEWLHHLAASFLHPA